VVVRVQVGTKKYISESSQERVTGNLTELLVKNLHRLNLDDGHKRSGIPLLISLPVRQPR
jgi:hypothetical protein